MLTGFRYPDEVDQVFQVAGDFGIDPRFLAALRTAENGGPGREYGVLSVPAPTYEAQIRTAARTIANNLKRYLDISGSEAVGSDGRYTDGFIAFFSSRYAPIGAENDPTGLNSYHYNNLRSAYANIEVA